ncbi:unnamed protein product [Linum trigynum]|uniref:Exocyst subunit Exo70 family protein n=1 Tax=Linum trigynum TaxID=586398 RepID=A0AAV2FJL7_9ROSI
MESNINSEQAHPDVAKPTDTTTNKDDPPPTVPDSSAAADGNDDASPAPHIHHSRSGHLLDDSSSSGPENGADKDGSASSPDQNGDVSHDPPPPNLDEEIHLTLQTLSPDIDHFLITLSERKMVVSSQETLVGEMEEKKEHDEKQETEDKDEKNEDPISGEKEAGSREHKPDSEEAGPDDEEGKKEEEKEKQICKKRSTILMPEFVEKYVDLVDGKIRDRDSSSDGKGGGGGGKWCLSPDDDALFMEIVNRFSRLASSLNEFRSDPDHAHLVNRIGSIHQRAMSYLEDEFGFLLQEHANQQPVQEPDSAGKSSAKAAETGEGGSPLPESQSKLEEEKESPYPGYSEETVTNLRNIASQMIAGGYESECCQVYMIVRRHALDETLIQSGFEKISIDDVQKMAWENLEREIPIMTSIIKECASVHFPKEHKLVHSVFSNYPSLSISLFSNLSRGILIQFLNFAEGVAMSKRSTEKLFKFLDMYETLRDGFAAIEGLYPEESEGELKTEATTVKGRIGEAAINIFSDLEHSIKNDHGKTPVPGGAVHPLTRYTMNYLKYAFEYKSTLENVFREHSKIERADSTSRPRFEGDSNQAGGGGDQDNNQSPFAGQLARIMDFLDQNLESKSQLYRDVSLCCIFMMNNGRYILQKIKSSPEIHCVMGDPWCRRKSSDLRNYHKGYQRETWSKLLGCLAQEGVQVHGKVSKTVLKERFKNFNIMFDEIHRTQSQWVVSDEQLQSELRVSIAAVVIPAYRAFLGRFSQYFTPGRQYEKYVKYQAEDIENCVEELFEGNASSIARRR